MNQTNYRTLTWYFGIKETQQTGLKHFELLYQEPMQSTGKEKFTVYVYYKTKRYDPKEDKEWLSSDESSSQDEEGSSEKVEEVKLGKRGSKSSTVKKATPIAKGNKRRKWVSINSI